MTNVEIAAVFEHVADLLEFQGANPFRIRAYRNAARTIHDLPESVDDILADQNRSLLEIEGIGKDLADKITTLVLSGSLPMLDELLAEIPESVLAILRVPGLGPKKASILFHELKIKNIDQLREACQQHRVRELKGFGAKSEATILQGLDIASEADRRILWAEADQACPINSKPHGQLPGYRENRSCRQLSPTPRYRRRSRFSGHSHRFHCRYGSSQPLRRTGPSSGPRRYENVDPIDQRRASRSPRDTGNLLRRGTAIFHRFKTTQHRAARPSER